MNANSPFAAVAVSPEYTWRIEFWAIAGCLVLFGTLIELVRRHRLKEKYSFLWFLTAGVLLVFTIRRSWLEDFARLVGVYYPPTALFLLLVFFMLLILVHYSTVLTKLQNDKQVLVQKLGILETRVRSLEQTEFALPSPPANPDERTSSTEG